MTKKHILILEINDKNIKTLKDVLDSSVLNKVAIKAKTSK